MKKVLGIGLFISVFLLFGMSTTVFAAENRVFTIKAETVEDAPSSSYSFQKGQSSSGCLSYGYGTPEWYYGFLSGEDGYVEIAGLFHADEASFINRAGLGLRVEEGQTPHTVSISFHEVEGGEPGAPIGPSVYLTVYNPTTGLQWFSVDVPHIRVPQGDFFMKVHDVSNLNSTLVLYAADSGNSAIPDEAFMFRFNNDPWEQLRPFSSPNDISNFYMEVCFGVEAVPTLNQWGLFIFILILASVSFLALRRRNRAL